MQNNLSQNAINLTLDRLKGVLGVKSDTQLADILGVRQNTVSSWRKRDSLDYSLVIAKCDDLGVDLNWVFGKSESKSNFQTKSEEIVLKQNEDNFEDKNEDIQNVYKSSSNFQTKSEENVVKSNDHNNAHKNDHKPDVQKSWSSKPKQIEPNTGTPTVEIPIADISAAAGGGAQNIEHFDTFGSIQLPGSMLHKGTHLCVNIEGRSMEPTLQSGGKVIIRLLDRPQWGHIKSNSLCVVTDREGNTYIKRLENNLRAHGYITFRSDNTDKQRYKSFDLEEGDIHNLWVVEWYLNNEFPEAYAEVNDRLDLIEGDMGEMKKMMRQLLKGR